MVDYNKKLSDIANMIDAYFLERESKNDHRELCLVFDIGTNAVRALIGPKLKLDEFHAWDPGNEKIFIAPSLPTKLGDDFDTQSQRLDIRTSTGLSPTISFLKLVAGKFNANFKSKGNIIAIGTAIFRWLGNQDEIIKHIEKNSGIQVKVIDSRTEAYLSLLAIANTYNKITNRKIRLEEITFGDNDVILLIDQGGGSTEVSYFFPKTKILGELKSMFHIGTRSLEAHFARKVGNKTINPLASGKKVVDAIEEIRLFSSAEVAHGLTDFTGDVINGYQEESAVVTNKYRVWVYGMGTAIKACFERHYEKVLNYKISGAKFHVWPLKIDEMEAIYKSKLADITGLTPTIRDLYNRRERLGDKERDVLNDDLSMLYGLPTFTTILNRLGLDTIRYAYYNLRYGAYLQRFVFGKEDLSKEEFDAEKKYEWDVFLCHSLKDKEPVKKIAQTLKENGITYWLDDEQILLSQNILELINHGLENSHFIIACFSENQLQSDWCGAEYQGFMHRILSKETNQKIIPLILDETQMDKIPLLLGPIKGGRYPDNLPDVVKAIRLLRG